jgi:hypothetical protein
MTLLWFAVWKVLQPQPLQSGMVCTLTSPRLSANSPKYGETSVVVTEWMCIHMSVHNSWMCSITSYRYDMDVMCSLKGSTVSTIAKWYGLHTYITWLLANSLKSGERLWWWWSECASICPSSPTVEGAQTPHISMTWMWYAVWKVLQPQL